MNTARPSRVPSPPQGQTAYGEPRHGHHPEEAHFEEVREQNSNGNLPSVARTEEARLSVAETVSERVEPVEPDLPASGPGGVIAAIAAIMAEIKPVEKAGWNDFQKYQHVRMQDLSRELTPLMGKHGIVVFQTEEGRELFDNGGAVAVRYRFTVVHKSGEIWPQRPLQTGVSSCRTTKGTFDDKALNKCHTAARKYFLLSLFQIASEDNEDADSDGRPVDYAQRQQRPQGRRQVPSPNGKVPPHTIPIIDQETPAAWANRFKTFVDKAESTAEIDKWYNENIPAFEKLKGRFQQIYDDTVDFMDACATKFTGGYSADAGKPKPDPITTGNGKPASDFPGDKQSSTMEATRIWLAGLDEAFAKCTDTEELASEQESIMMPSKDTVSKQTWDAAVAIVKKHLERIQNG